MLDWEHSFKFKPNLEFGLYFSVGAGDGAALVWCFPREVYPCVSKMARGGGLGLQMAQEGQGQAAAEG